jgi:hypothetical protein
MITVQTLKNIVYDKSKKKCLRAKKGKTYFHLNLVLKSTGVYIKKHRGSVTYDLSVCQVPSQLHVFGCRKRRPPPPPHPHLKERGRIEFIKVGICEPLKTCTYILTFQRNYQ